jgi:hypothetical protein
MDYGGKHVVGSLLSQTYDDLFLGAEFQAVRRMMGGEAGELLCRTCEHAISATREAGAGNGRAASISAGIAAMRNGKRLDGRVTYDSVSSSSASSVS